MSEFKLLLFDLTSLATVTFILVKAALLHAKELKRDWRDLNNQKRKRKRNKKGRR